MSSRPSFAKLPKPFLVAVIRENDPQNVIANIRNSEYDGADAYDLHLNRLDKQYRNYQDLRNIVTYTKRPVLLLNYPSDPDVTDEQRLEELKTGIKAGAAGIDMFGSLFDIKPIMSMEELTAYSMKRGSKPLEPSLKPDIIEKQKELIEEIHSMGAEVLLSAHTRVIMNTEQVIPMALDMESRGPDMIKIVTVCLNEDDLIEAFRTIVELKKVIKIPFQFQCHGQYGKLVRVVGPMLGSSLVFCNQIYKPGTHPDQPLLSSMRRVFQDVDWDVAKEDPGDSLNIT